MWVTAFRDEDWEIFAESFVGATAEVKLRAVNMLGGRRLFECVCESSECTRVGSNRVEVGTARVGIVTEPTVRWEHFLVKRSQLGGAKSYVAIDALYSLELAFTSRHSSSLNSPALFASPYLDRNDCFVSPARLGAMCSAGSLPAPPGSPPGSEGSESSRSDGS